MINSLDEAIKHCEEVAELNEECTRIYNEQGDTMASYSCNECAEEHRQLAKWLRELQECREIMEFIDSNVRVIETNDGVMIRFGGGNVCEWARRKGEHL